MPGHVQAAGLQDGVDEASAQLVEGPGVGHGGLYDPEGPGLGSALQALGRVRPVLASPHPPVVRDAELERGARDDGPGPVQPRPGEHEAAGHVAGGADLHGVAHALGVHHVGPLEGHGRVDELHGVFRDQQLGDRRREAVDHHEAERGAGDLVAGLVCGHHMPHEVAGVRQVLAGDVHQGGQLAAALHGREEVALGRLVDLPAVRRVAVQEREPLGLGVGHEGVGAGLADHDAPPVGLPPLQHAVRRRVPGIGEPGLAVDHAMVEVLAGRDLQRVGHAVGVGHPGPLEAHGGVDQGLVVGRCEQLGQRRREAVLHHDAEDPGGRFVARQVLGPDPPDEVSGLRQLVGGIEQRDGEAGVELQRGREVPGHGLVQLEGVGHGPVDHDEPEGGRHARERARPGLAGAHPPVVLPAVVQGVGRHRVPGLRQSSGLVHQPASKLGVGGDLDRVGHTAGIEHVRPAQRHRRVEQLARVGRCEQHGDRRREAVLHVQLEGRRDRLVAGGVRGPDAPQVVVRLGQLLLRLVPGVREARPTLQGVGEVAGRRLVQLERVPDVLVDHPEVVHRAHGLERAGALLQRAHPPPVLQAEGEGVVGGDHMPGIGGRGRVGQASVEARRGRDLQHVQHTRRVLDLGPHEGDLGVDDLLFGERQQQSGSRRRELIHHLDLEGGGDARVAGQVRGRDPPDQSALLGQGQLRDVHGRPQAASGQQRYGKRLGARMVELPEVADRTGDDLEALGQAHGTQPVGAVLGGHHPPPERAARGQRAGSDGEPRLRRIGPFEALRRGEVGAPGDLHRIDDAVVVLDCGPGEGHGGVEHLLVGQRQQQLGHRGRELVVHLQQGGGAGPAVAGQVGGHHAPAVVAFLGQGLVRLHDGAGQIVARLQRGAEVPTVRDQLPAVLHGLVDDVEAPGEADAGAPASPVFRGHHAPVVLLPEGQIASGRGQPGLGRVRRDERAHVSEVRASRQLHRVAHSRRVVDRRPGEGDVRVERRVSVQWVHQPHDGRREGVEHVHGGGTADRLVARQVSGRDLPDEVARVGDGPLRLVLRGREGLAELRQVVVGHGHGRVQRPAVGHLLGDEREPGRQAGRRAAAAADLGGRYPPPVGAPEGELVVGEHQPGLGRVRRCVHAAAREVRAGGHLDLVADARGRLVHVGPLERHRWVEQLLARPGQEQLRHGRRELVDHRDAEGPRYGLVAGRVGGRHTPDEGPLVRDGLGAVQHRLGEALQALQRGHEGVAAGLVEFPPVAARLGLDQEPLDGSDRLQGAGARLGHAHTPVVLLPVLQRAHRRGRVGLPCCRGLHRELRARLEARVRGQLDAVDHPAGIEDRRPDEGDLGVEDLLVPQRRHEPGHRRCKGVLHQQ